MKNINTILKLIKYPNLTNKNIFLIAKKKCCLFIDKSLTKNDIKYLFNIFFNLKLNSINICNLPLKIYKIKKFKGYTSNYKKCYITFYKHSQLIFFYNFINYLIF
jgi:large subunit ribosomal protein L23